MDSEKNYVLADYKLIKYKLIKFVYKHVTEIVIWMKTGVYLERRAWLTFDNKLCLVSCPWLSAFCVDGYTLVCALVREFHVSEN